MAALAVAAACAAVAGAAAAAGASTASHSGETTAATFTVVIMGFLFDVSRMGWLLPSSEVCSDDMHLCQGFVQGLS